MRYMLVVLVILLSFDVLAIGISPPSLNFDNARRGASIHQQIHLSGVGKGDMVNFEIRGDAADWIIFDVANPYTFPKDKDSVAFDLVVDIPKSAPNGAYQAVINFYQSSDAVKDSSAADMSLKVGVKAKIFITVTGEQVKDYIIKSVQVQDVEYGSRIPLILNIENRGNVRVMPTMVSVEIFDKYNVDLISSANISSWDSVSPFSQEQIISYINEILSPGEYWVHLSVFDEVVIFDDDVVLKVYQNDDVDLKGSMQDLDVEELQDGVLLINSHFLNEGTLPVIAKLKLEIFRGMSLVKILGSDYASIKSGEKKDFKIRFDPVAPGNYKIVGYIEYSGAETEVMSLDYSVKSQEVPEPSGFSIVGSDYGEPIVAGIIVMIFAIGLIIYRRVYAK